MKLYCPRCDVEFIKDLARCPGCGWDFRAHRIPDRFLEKPLDFTPVKEFGKFVASNIPLIFINGISIEVVGFITAWIIYRITTLVPHVVIPHDVLNPIQWITPFVSVLAFVLMFPIWANYLYSLLRRYRYHVAVPLFSILPPGGTYLYVQILAWAPWCFLISVMLLFALVFPGVIFLFIFLPFLLLLTLDKRNISSRRRTFILALTFKKIWLIFLITGLILSIVWSIGFAAPLLSPILLIIPALLLPLQSVFSMLLYESLLGRVNLDVE
jgi:hypothetical protein